MGEVIKNVQCGYDVRRKDYVSCFFLLFKNQANIASTFPMPMQPGDLTQVIYDRGCLRSGEDWVKRNLVPVAAVAVALAVLQVLLTILTKQYTSSSSMHFCCCKCGTIKKVS